ncbi:FliH/SctL family protein, partial [Paraburkholderia kirstenboschensis]
MHMSNRNSTAKESLSAYQRWEMASFDPVPPAPPTSEIDEAAFEAELERLREAAHAQGIASGHVAGQALGYQAGYDQGHAQGFEQGRSEAREEAARLAALAETFKAALDGAQGAISETLVALALDIAQQVVRQHVQHDPTALIAAARE